MVAVVKCGSSVGGSPIMAIRRAPPFLGAAAGGVGAPTKAGASHAMVARRRTARVRRGIHACGSRQVIKSSRVGSFRESGRVVGMGAGPPPPFLRQVARARHRALAAYSAFRDPERISFAAVSGGASAPE